MSRKKIAIATIIAATTISLGGATLVGFDLMRDEARVLVTSISMSESSSLLLFGSGLWAVAMFRRHRRRSPSV